MHFLMFVVVCLLWGHSFLLMKIAEPVFGALGVAAGRQVLGAATLGTVWFVTAGTWPLRRSDVPALAVLALFGYALPFTLQPFVIERVQHFAGHGSAFGGFLVGFVPLLTILVSIPMLGRYPSRREALGVCGGLAFLAMLFGAELHAGVPAWLLGVGAITPLAYATANTWVRRRFHHAHPLGLAMSALTVGSVYLLPVTVISEPIQLGEGFWPALAAVVVLGVACSGLALACFYRLIQQRGPLYAGMVTYVIPCISMGVGWWDGELLRPGQLVAIAGVFLMVALVQAPVFVRRRAAVDRVSKRMD